MNIFEFIVAMAIILTIFILGLAYIAGKYNLLAESKRKK